MSLEYFVLCRTALPPRSEGYDGVLVGAAQIDRVDAADLRFLDRVGFSPVAVVAVALTRMSTVDAEHFEASLDWARRLTDLVRGELWCEDGPDGPELDYAARTTELRPEELDLWWESRIAGARASGVARVRRDASRYEAARASDPEALPDADDWSDVASD